MIKVNELRDGNYVIDPKDGEMKRTNIYQLGKHQINDKLTDYLPINLMREILIKFGFEAFPWGWVKKSKSDFGVRLRLTSFSYEVSGNNPVSLKYVHQLQNLYFALTGEELVLSNGA